MNKKLSIGRMAGTVTNYIEIEVTLEGGRLSICGDVRRETAGQCQDFIREAMEGGKIDYSGEWDGEKLKKLLDTWDAWHLNDMHPECEHQAVDGTLEQARQEVTIYGYKLSDEASKQKRDIEERTQKELLETRSTGITEEEQTILKLEHFTKSLDATPAKFYVAYGKEDSYFGNKTERRGWMNFSEYPEVGLLGKPCATCGYKYGTAWKTVELPKEALEYIASL
jgi:hypothetical protein